MDTILVATDFSERSDQAVDRAAMIATRTGARLHLVHAVDDDQKPQIVQGETALSQQLLDEEAGRLKQIRDMDCTTAVVLGDPFEGIGHAAAAVGADLVVLGAHRRRLLRDVFVGTTAQRTIRRARCPVLMVNAPPERAYADVILATELSERSREAAEQLAALDLTDRGKYTLLHVLEAPEQRLVMRDVLQKSQMDRHLVELQVEAEQALRELAADLPVGEWSWIAFHSDAATSMAILEAAAGMKADLIAVSSQGRVGLSRTFTGSVAEEVLRRADRDVLAIPPEPST